MSTISVKLVSGLRRMLVTRSRSIKIAMMVGADVIALPACYFAAMIIRLGSYDEVTRYGVVVYVLIALLTIEAFALTGLYRAVIRFIDFRLLTLTGAVLAVVVLLTCFISIALHFDRQPNSAFVIYWFVAFSYVVTSRMAARAFLRHHGEQRRGPQNFVAIYGAGERGAQVAVAMRNSDEYRPICFFDEKHMLNKRTIEGLRVFHSGRLLEEVKKYRIKTIVIAIPSASPDRLLKIVHMMREAGVEVKIQHSLIGMADDKLFKHSLREIKIDDLLGRDRVPPQGDLVAKCITGKNVLVTGAGGSVGSEMCRQIMSLSPNHLHLIDHCEFALYTIKQELQARYPELNITGHLGSVCSASLVERLIREGKIHTVYHAAAYKHVPLVEANVAESIRNNVIGAKVVADSSLKGKVETCVLISSDKAVRPTNIMGATKRIAELIFQTAAMRPGNRTTFCMVRFGNVLGSSGSVVPLFQKQIEHGGPITITHPDVVRYFMLIQEAAQLVIQAGAMARGGDVFVLDMGKPIKILDLARTMIVLSGFTEKTEANPNGEIEVKYVGLRPGEKMYEELLIGECSGPSQHPRIMYAQEDSMHFRLLDDYVEELLATCDTNSRQRIEAMVGRIVSEYRPKPIKELEPMTKEAIPYVPKTVVQGPIPLSA